MEKRLNERTEKYMDSERNRCQMLDCRQKSSHKWIAGREESDMDCGQRGSQIWTSGREGVIYGLWAERELVMDR
jgi:hypothetical protein